MVNEEAFRKLNAMKLFGMVSALAEQQKGGDYESLSYEERIGFLIDREWTDREARKLSRRLRYAKLREQACIEDIDYRTNRGLDKRVIRRLAESKWVAEKQNVIITGATGVGKTYIACALSQEACRDGYTALYRRVPRLLGELAVARADGSFERLLSKLAKTDVLVLDDWGLAPLEDQERRDVLEVLEDRYANRSVIVATQLPTNTWHGYIGEPTLADAIVDRLLHNAHTIELSGDSIRKTKNRLAKETRSAK
ncbi:MAG: IS21-like element helper ATPase IstB [Myxococcota bacterium]